MDHLSSVSAFGRCVAAGPDMSVLLHDACELAASVMQADMLLVARLTENAKKLSLQIASFNESRKVIIQNPEAISTEPDISMAAFTMHSADVVQCEDIVAERRFTDLFLRRLQMGSGVSVPLCSHNRAFGALGLFRKEPSFFTTDETNFIRSIAQLFGSFLTQNDAEEQLERREASMKATLDSVESLILSLDGRGSVREMNAAGIRITGFRDRELRDRPFWNTLIVPRDSERVATVFRQSARLGSDVMFDADLLSKEGQHRAVQWSLSAVEIDEGSPKSYVLSGVDRTELRECSKELEKYRRIAQGATGAGEQSEEESDGEQPAAKPSGSEKRSSPRREYRYFQRIAPILEDRLPDDDDFIKVVCCDISAGGFSFLSGEPPRFDELLISLGTPPKDRKIIGKVVRIVNKEVNGQPSYLVGCQFTGRVGN